MAMYFFIVNILSIEFHVYMSVRVHVCDDAVMHVLCAKQDEWPPCANLVSFIKNMSKTTAVKIIQQPFNRIDSCFF